MHAQFPLGKKADQSFCVRKEALGLMLMSIMPMIRCYIIGNVQMCSKAFYFSKVGLGYIGNSAISLQKKIDINLRARLCLGHYAFHNSACLIRLQLPVLNSRLLYQASLPYVKFSDCCHSAHEPGSRHILPSAALACAVSQVKRIKILGIGI